MQSTPVENQEKGRQDRERIGGGRGIEDTRDRFSRVEQTFLPDLRKERPVPRIPESELLQSQIGCRLQGSKDGELKCGVGQREQRKD